MNDCGRLKDKGKGLGLSKRHLKGPVSQQIHGQFTANLAIYSRTLRQAFNYRMIPTLGINAPILISLNTAEDAWHTLMR